MHIRLTYCSAADLVRCGERPSWKARPRPRRPAFTGGLKLSAFSFAGQELLAGAATVQLLRGTRSPIVAGSDGLSVLYLFGGDPQARGAGYVLLRPGAKPVESWSASSELLLVGCRDVPAPPLGANGQWRQDPSVQTLAHEMRRGLLMSQRPPLPYFEHLARALVLAGLAAAERRKARRAARLPTPRLDRVLREVEERLREPLSVDQLARLAGMSRARFADAFKETMGQSPMAYVRDRRLEAVRRALEAGERDLARIAVRCGFSSHAHMSTSFRIAFGLSPSAYRAKFGAIGLPTRRSDGVSLPDEIDALSVRREGASAQYTPGF